MSPSNERSAEWLGGAKHAIERLSFDWPAKQKLVEHYAAELAAAEAREATEPTAAEVIGAVEKAMNRFKSAWQSWPPSTDGLAHATHLGGAMETMDAALALIARWKEANGGMPVL